ncbi:MAG: efflux RND transporter periplasmic adaptor subunit [Vicinamibacterales bacterium]
MTTASKLAVAACLLAAAGGIGYGVYHYRQREIKAVTVETVVVRDLQAVVTASGKIQPKRSINISADTMGRVTELAVEEGQVVKRGDFLLQIDPRNLEAQTQRGEASVAVASAQLDQLRTSVTTAQEQLALARDTLRRQRELWNQQLTTRESLDRAESEVRVREADVKERMQQVTTQEQRIRAERADLANARYNLTKVRIVSPIDGIVTRRNIEQGEMVVIGTMNNAGTVLLTIADMSIVEAEVEVDETDIPSIRIGQPAVITVDAIPEQKFAGRVTEIGNSPIQTTSATTTGQQATNFKVVVTLDGQIPLVRPGFTCTAEITTATRAQVVSVPIQALLVRELTYDASGHVVRPTAGTGQNRDAAPSADLPPGQVRRETEGVFVFRESTAAFVPVTTGIAGERYFEVLGGLEAGTQVITGPFASVREIRDGDRVRLEDEQDRRRP